MPIPVECPGCGAHLNAPDSGAGKKVRCPKPNCGELIPVPAPLVAEEIEVVDATPIPPPRRPRRRRDNDEEDRPRGRRRDEDDEDDRRPTRRRRGDEEDDRSHRDRPGRRRGLGTPVVVAIVLGSLLALGGIGYGVYAMLGGKKTALPPGWKEYTYANDGFKAAFPKEPQVTDMIGLGGGKGAGGFPGFGAGDMGSVNHYTSGGASDAVHIQVIVYRFPSGIPSMFRDQMAQGFRDMPGLPAGPGVETKSVKWMGESATEVATPNSLMRLAVTDRAVYQAVITGKNGRRATSDEEKAFFDNFVPAR
jgi:hypothetical protein